MRYTTIAFVLLFFTSFTLWGQEKNLIEWKSIQTADSLQMKGDHRFLFVDVYADWCGPCKLMDSHTFHNEEVAKFINENFIPVKFNAEAHEKIIFKGKEYDWISNGRTGIQSLAYFMLGGELRYPSMPVIDSKGQTVTIISGYFQPEEFMPIMKDVKKRLEEINTKTKGQ